MICSNIVLYTSEFSESHENLCRLTADFLLFNPIIKSNIHDVLLKFLTDPPSPLKNDIEKLNTFKFYRIQYSRGRVPNFDTT